MVLISNCVPDAKEAKKAYRDKEIVDKVFVGFISLILFSGVHKVMTEKRFCIKMTMKKLILILSKLKLQIMQGVQVLFPVTKEQLSICEAFDIEKPV